MPNHNLKFKINKKSILIFGITGQDGSLLAEQYLKKKYKVFGVFTNRKKNLINLKKYIKKFGCFNV